MAANACLKRRADCDAAQLDIEMAFTPVEGIIGLGEELMAAAFKAALGVDLPRPFPRMTYAEAMDRYGCDKPDTRYGLELHDISAAVRCVSVLPFCAVSDIPWALRCRAAVSASSRTMSATAVQ